MLDSQGAAQDVSTPAVSPTSAPSDAQHQGESATAGTYERLLSKGLSRPASSPEEKQETVPEATPQRASEMTPATDLRAQIEGAPQAVRDRITELERQAETSKPVEALVREFGGADRLRQYQPLLSSLEQPDPGEAAKGLSQALSQLSPDVQDAFIYGVVDANRDHFLEYLGVNRDGQAPSAAALPTDLRLPDFDLEEYKGEPIYEAVSLLKAAVADREAALQQVRAQTEQMDARVRGHEQQAEQATIAQQIERVNHHVFGRAVNSAFESLNWNDEDVRDTFDAAMLRFSRDAEGQKYLQQARHFATTGDRRFQGADALAANSFARHLAQAVERQGRLMTPPAAADKRERFEPDDRTRANTPPQTESGGRELDGEGDPEKIAAVLERRFNAANARLARLNR